MPLGPGKYDEVASMAMQLTQARGVVLIVIDGSRGEGFEVQTHDAKLLAAMPAILRHMADVIEKGGDPS